MFGLLGPNGAGKTTAVRILTTILEPDGGTAEVLGFDVVRDAERVRLRIGLAGQSATVDPNLTGRENLRLVGRLAQRPRAWVALRAAELLDLFELSPAADRPIKTYSGGMRRRLDVAAALVGRPAGPVPRRAYDGPGPRRAGTRSGGRSATWSRTAPPCC